MAIKLASALALALAVSLTALAAGCGSGGSAGAGSLTKAQFIKRGNAICRQGEKEILAAYSAASGGPGSSSSLTRGKIERVITASVLPVLQGEADGLANLGAPQGDEGKIGAIVEKIEAAVAKGEKDPGSFLGTRPMAEAGGLAEEYGLNECGT
jgi:hypothetical protein